MDEYSAWVWATPLTTLKKVGVSLSNIVEVSLHQRTDHAVRYLRTDGGTEWTSEDMKDLLRLHCIEHELTCPNTSWQNGKAERHIGILFSTVRTLFALRSSPVRSGVFRGRRAPRRMLGQAIY